MMAISLHEPWATLSVAGAVTGKILCHGPEKAFDRICRGGGRIVICSTIWPPSDEALDLILAKLRKGEGDNVQVRADEAIQAIEATRRRQGFSYPSQMALGTVRVDQPVQLDERRWLWPFHDPEVASLAVKAPLYAVGFYEWPGSPPPGGAAVRRAA